MPAKENNTIKMKMTILDDFLDKPDKSSIFSKYFSSLLQHKKRSKNAKFINK